MKNRKSNIGKIELPLSEAFRISLDQIRKRFTRSSLVIASITVGIAFMVYIQMTNLVFRNYMKEEGTIIEAYQFWLVVVSLLTCSVGLINSTIIATVERYREIGTMKCLGALNQHILGLFLIEAILFGFLGGAFGFIMGGSIALISSFFQLGLNIFLNIPVIEVLLLFCFTLILSVILSVLATAYPALKAARLYPVEALRYDV